MAIYIHLFETTSAFTEEYNSNYNEPWLSYTLEDEEVNYNKSKEERLLGTELTIEALGSGNISWALGDMTVQYSKNGASWETMTSSTTIPVVASDEVRFKGTNSHYGDDTPTYNNITCTAQFNVKGNIMSITDGDNFKTSDTAGGNAFPGLFKGNTTLISAEDLRLPAKTADTYAYSAMFSGCTSMTTAPESIPTEEFIGNYVCINMFSRCTSLVTPPNLLTTSLYFGCYQSMFKGCTSLTVPPKLTAMTLTERCYREMFNGCTGLTSAPELPATSLADTCYAYMFSGCTSLVNAPSLPATTLAPGCYSNMFASCVSLQRAPVLPALTLVNSCYGSMFRYCTSLIYLKAMFTSSPIVSGSYPYTSSWVQNVSTSSEGVFVKNSAATWTNTRGGNLIPYNWTIETASS